jgi:dethiobiotin synthetase
LKGRIVVVTGTGTGIGKTHFAEALLLAARGRKTVGVKPVETGVPDERTDARRLDEAATFHVKRFAYAFAEPVSPHLAARAEGVEIDIGRLATEVRRLGGLAQLVVVELAGGLFSPLSDRTCNADLLRAIRPDATFLVAPDRLGVLHDVAAAAIAARSRRLSLDGVVLVTPEVPDTSTGRNAREIPLVSRLEVAAVLPRAPAASLAQLRAVRALVTSAPSPRGRGSARGNRRRAPRRIRRRA